MNVNQRSNRLLMWMALSLAGLLVLVTVIILVREPASFEPGTPEATVQDYVGAILDDDQETAWALLTPRLQTRCDVDEIDTRYRRGDRGRIVLVESRQRDDTATVELEFNAAYGDDPFYVYESSYSESFRLRRVEGEWRISDIPWPFYWCSEV